MTRTTEILRKARRPLSSLASRLRRWRNPDLAGPLSGMSDAEIDAALARANLDRGDLFRPGSSIASYRFRMACMLTALGIRSDDAVRDHWNALKEADGKCSRCKETGRCVRWLEWGRPNTAPSVFCPNAELFLSLVDEQTESRAREGL